MWTAWVAARHCNVAVAMPGIFPLPEGRAIIATDGVEGQATQMRRWPRPARGQGPRRRRGPGHHPRGAVIPISARAGGGGRLFGSISAADVVDAIKEAKGVEIDRRHVLLAEPIKEVGSFDVTIDLFAGVATVVTVEVAPVPERRLGRGGATTWVERELRGTFWYQRAVR